METAKVDIRKLQLLNDSINRTIEALNQVRLSVHGAGLNHTAAIGAPPYAAGFGGPFGIGSQIAGQPMVGMMPGIGGVGLGHTAAGAYYPAMAAQAAQAAQAAWTTPWASPFASAGYPYYAQQGLGHTASDGSFGYADPYAAARIAQTFPFVHWGYSPFAWPNA